MDPHAYGGGGYRQPLLRGVGGADMQKTAIRERNWTLVGLVGLGVIALALAVLAFSRTRDLNAANNTITGIYEKAFYETCELTESMAINLNKLAVASGGTRGDDPFGCHQAGAGRGGEPRRTPPGRY